MVVFFAIKDRRGSKTLSLVIGVSIPIAFCIFAGLLTSKYWALGGLALGHGGLTLGHGNNNNNNNNNSSSKIGR